MCRPAISNSPVLIPIGGAGGAAKDTDSLWIIVVTFYVGAAWCWTTLTVWTTAGAGCTTAGVGTEC